MKITLRLTSVAVSFVVAFALSGCTPRPALAPASSEGGALVSAHELLASIERTGCYGWCPIYKLTVFRDGLVEYEGKEYVKTRGKATGHLTPEQLGALDVLFQQNRYVDLRDEYVDYSVTDMPSVFTSYSVGGKVKVIKHYLGDFDAPKALTEIEEGIERIVGVERWIGTEKERENLGRRAR